MKQRLSLFATHLCVCIAEHETNRSEKITLSRSIAPDDNVMFR